MIKKIIIATLFFSSTIFGEINDLRKIFDEQTTENLDSTLKIFQNETGENIYLNTLESDKDFEIKDTKKVVVLNLIRDKKNNNNILKIQLKLSQDINPEEISSEINTILNNVGELTKDNDEALIATDIITNLQDILVKRQDLRQEDVESESSSLTLIVIFGIVLTFILISIRIMQVKRKKSSLKKR